MALFGTKKEKKEVVKAIAKVDTKSSKVDMVATSIVKPHITEKSGILSQSGVYTFVISRDANKDQVSKAIKMIYKVTPIRVAIINLPAKRVFVRGKRGTVKAVRKAIVTLKKGDKIDFV